MQKPAKKPARGLPVKAPVKAGDWSDYFDWE